MCVIKTTAIANLDELRVLRSTKIILIFSTWAICSSADLHRLLRRLEIYLLELRQVLKFVGAAYRVFALTSLLILMIFGYLCDVVGSSQTAK